MNAVRAWTFSVREDADEGRDDEVIRGLRTLASEAARVDVYLILALSDYWNRAPSALKTCVGDENADDDRAFYEKAACRDAYKRHARRVVETVRRRTRVRTRRPGRTRRDKISCGITRRRTSISPPRTFGEIIGRCIRPPSRSTARGSREIGFARTRRTRVEFCANPSSSRNSAPPSEACFLCNARRETTTVARRIHDARLGFFVVETNARE